MSVRNYLKEKLTNEEIFYIKSGNKRRINNKINEVKKRIQNMDKIEVAEIRIKITY